jgi:hypothetical protein
MKSCDDEPADSQNHGQEGRVVELHELGNHL